MSRVIYTPVENASENAGGETTRICPHCGKSFTRPASYRTKNGILHCSIACAAASGWVTKTCEQCGKGFSMIKSLAAQRKQHFCSRECRTENGKKNRYTSYVCECCGKTYQRANSRPPARHYFCSKTCRKIWEVRERSVTWKGGVTIGARDVIYTYAKDIGLPKPKPYIAVHRKVAGDAIGRPLETHEHVLHLDGDNRNNACENLFICGTVGECQRRISGKLPWPRESNLSRYEQIGAANDDDYRTGPAADTA